MAHLRTSEGVEVMALPSTIYRFTLDISDVDRAVYDSAELRIAQHPSETAHYLVTRVIAYALHVSDGVEMSRAGLCDPSDPPILARDLTGKMTLWIDIGQPSPERLHKATKAANSVFVYTYKKPQLLIDSVAKATVHRVEDIQYFSLAPSFLDALANCLARNNQWSIVRTENELFVTTGEESFSATLTPHRLVD